MEYAEATRHCRPAQGNRRWKQYDWWCGASRWRASGCSGEARQPARRVGKVPVRSVRGNDTDNTCDGCMIDEQINSSQSIVAAIPQLCGEGRLFRVN